jgi:phage terminase large subunit GpA-like protein
MPDTILSPEFYADSVEWLIDQIDKITDGITDRGPVQWAEEVRYLPQDATENPGLFSFNVTPYLREIVECAGKDHIAREVAVMKGVQVGYSTGVLENVLGYFIDEIGTAPCMWVTADAEMAKDRLESNIMPMIQQ